MKLWEKNIRVIEPYVPGEQPAGNIIKLNTNENPYPPTPKVLEATRQFDTRQLKFYPEASSKILVDELALYYGMDSNQVFVGVGSDDVLAMSFLTFFNSQKPILFPDITYSFYDVWAKLYAIPYERPSVDESFRIKKEDYYKENGGVIIANPNAPTSICEDLNFVEDILKNNQDVVVIIDEAYIDFGGNSALSLIGKYENLLVVQTFSKSRSMAGMRIGYAMGNKSLIQALNNVKNSYNSYTMTQMSLSVGVEAVKDDIYFKKTINKIINTRERVKKELEKLGFLFLDSKTNFIFTTHKSVSAIELFEAMRKDNIFVRHFSTPRVENYLRISIGTDEEMDIFLGWVKRYLESI
jgi:histidinol-phosphate aminotransferase